MAIDLNKKLAIECMYFGQPVVFHVKSLAEQASLHALEALSQEQIDGFGLAAKPKIEAAQKAYAVRVVESIDGLAPAPDMKKRGKVDETGDPSGSWADGVPYPLIRALATTMQTSYTPDHPRLEEAEKNG